MITQQPALEEIWPRVASAVGATLRRRGVPAGAIDDIVQETALRAIVRQVPYTDGDDLLRWVQTVAWRLAVDRHRGQRKIVGGPMVDAPATVDVAREVEGRAELDVVIGALRTMSAADQAALVDPAPAANDRTVAVRDAVRRHRARRRLLALVETSLSTVIGVLGRLIRLARRRPALVVAAPIVVLTGIFELGLAPVGPTPHIAREPLSSRSHLLIDRRESQSGRGPAVVLAAVIGRPKVSRPSPPPPPVKVVSIPVPGPAGDRGDAGIREKEPQDHLACADTIVAGWQCIDLPVRITQ